MNHSRIHFVKSITARAIYRIVPVLFPNASVGARFTAPAIYRPVRLPPTFIDHHTLHDDPPWL